MEIIILDLKAVTEEELINAIENNNRSISTLQKSIDTLKSKSNLSTKKKENISTEKIENTLKQVDDESNEDLKSEIDYYFSMVSSYSDSDYLSYDLETSVPSKKHTNYNNIMLGIKLALLKEIKEFEELIGVEGIHLSKDDLEEFIEYIKLNKKKIDILTLIENQKSDENNEEIIENNFVFVPTSGGNIRIIDEIDNMPTEFISRFKGLFDSIKDGTFKNVKTFNSVNNRNSGMSQVKDYQVRVIFDRIGPRDYALITAFIKKCNTDKGYLETMNLKIKNYELQKDKLKQKLDDPDFRKLQENYTSELYKMLGAEEKGVSYIKKGGESNA